MSVQPGENVLTLGTEVTSASTCSFPQNFSRKSQPCMTQTASGSALLMPSYTDLPAPERYSVELDLGVISLKVSQL